MEAVSLEFKDFNIDAFSRRSLYFTNDTKLINMSSEKKAAMSFSDSVSLFLQSPQCYALLEEYAGKEFTSENLYFWHDISEYRRLLASCESREQIEDFEKNMVFQYIEDSAEFSLNLSASMKAAVLKNPHHSSVWSQVQLEVAKLIRSGPYMSLAMTLCSRVRSSWTKALEKYSLDEMGELFYTNMFELDPSLRPLFSEGRMAAKGTMFSVMVNALIDLLLNLEKLLENVLEMGRQHRRLGVNPEAFITAEKALFATLKQALGDDFDAQTHRSWNAVYELLTLLMTLAMNDIEPNSLASQTRSRAENSQVRLSRDQKSLSFSASSRTSSVEEKPINKRKKSSKWGRKLAMIRKKVRVWRWS